MYADEKNRPIPKTLDKCLERGEVEKDLWKWSEHVEAIGTFVCLAIVIAGFFASLFLSIEQVDTGYYHSSKETSFDGMTFLITMGIFGVIACVQYIAFRIAALLLGAQASIVENTRINANIAMFKAAQEEQEKTAE